MSPLTRAWHLCVLSYIVASVLHTTSFLFIHLFGAPVKTLGLGFSTTSSLWVAKDTWELSRTINADILPEAPDMAALLEDPGTVNVDSDVLGLNIWPQLNSSSGNGTSARGKNLSLEEQLIFSKAFSTSMRPSKIVPYFYRATERLQQDDITITSIITSDRLEVFARLVEKYKGTFIAHGVPLHRP